MFSSNGFMADDCAAAETARARLTQNAKVRMGRLMLVIARKGGESPQAVGGKVRYTLIRPAEEKLRSARNVGRLEAAQPAGRMPALRIRSTNGALASSRLARRLPAAGVVTRYTPPSALYTATTPVKTRDSPW